MLSVVTVSSTSATPKRYDGIVKVKGEQVTVEYKKPGQVKSATASFSVDDCIYKAGSPGFVIAMTLEPVTTFVGKASMKDGITTISTEDGDVIVTKLPGAHISMTQVEEDSREARAAERAGKVRVKLPGARRAKEEASSKSSKKSSDKGSRTEAKKKRRR